MTKEAFEKELVTKLNEDRDMETSDAAYEILEQETAFIWKIVSDKNDVIEHLKKINNTLTQVVKAYTELL